MRREPLAYVETVSHVAIEVRDLAASVAFYEQVLGMRVVTVAHDATPPNLKGLVGDFLIEIAALPPGVDGDALAAARRAGPTLWLSLAVRDARGAFARIRKAGLTTADAPQESDGAVYFHLRDPDGYVIEFIELADARTLSARVAARQPFRLDTGSIRD